MDELVREVLAGEEAWFVGGAVRDELLGRRIVDVDIVCREPERAARAYAERAGGAPFPLSTAHASWRVVLRGQPERQRQGITPKSDSVSKRAQSRRQVAAIGSAG